MLLALLAALSLTAPLRLPTCCNPRAIGVAMAAGKLTVSLADMPCVCQADDESQPTLGRFALDAFLCDDTERLEDAAIAHRLLLNGDPVGLDALSCTLHLGDTVEVLPAVDTAASAVDDSLPPPCTEQGLGCLKGRRLGRSRSRPPAMATSDIAVGGGISLKLHQRTFHGSTHGAMDATGTTLWPTALPLLLHLQGA